MNLCDCHPEGENPRLYFRKSLIIHYEIIIKDFPLHPPSRDDESLNIVQKFRARHPEMVDVKESF
jgi:hypothetical protein